MTLLANSTIGLSTGGGSVTDLRGVKLGTAKFGGNMKADGLFLFDC